ncbi:hypothetical protein L1987_16365 [Smallanthus sonchifolius]|uniref:Uncharacterized protein n=1 Tax=Smallanthus sonchifolius TaxID=185202 RepID=A0ACB9J949_9ASTR|nr:hypothetical protein L1987_16365 [Smallanthus sonchifolius]
MITTKPKGYDVVSYMRRLAKDGFKGIKNPIFAKTSLKRYAYSHVDSHAKQRMHKRVYDVLDLRYLVPAESIAKSEMKVACHPRDEYEAKHGISIIMKLGNMAKGLPEEDEE